MKRRNFLAGSAAVVSLAALGSSALLYENRYSFIPGLLHDLIGDFRMDQQQEEDFVDALTEHYGAEKMAAFIGIYRLRSNTGLGMEYTNNKIEQFERMLVTEFITSTDYLSKQHEKVPSVVYRGFRLPCSNPFAQLTA